MPGRDNVAARQLELEIGDKLVDQPIVCFWCSASVKLGYDSTLRSWYVANDVTLRERGNVPDGERSYGGGK